MLEEQKNGIADPEKKEPENTPAEDKKEEKKEPEKKEPEKKEPDKTPNYRPQKDDKGESVPLKKYLGVKTKNKDLEDRVKELEGQIKLANSSSNSFKEEDLEEIAEENGLTVAAVKKLADKIVGKTKAEAMAEVQKVIEKTLYPLLAKSRQDENEKNFETDFKNRIVKKYPHLKDHKDRFKRLVMSPDFVEMSEDQIVSEYFPAPKGEKKDTVEGGSTGNLKGTETIDFKTLNQNPELYSKVMANPKLKAKYFEWQDQQGL